MLAVGRQTHTKFPPGFFAWLARNHHIYRAFERRALQMAWAGRTRYSARTIVEVIRWDTELADSTTTFKIDNVFIPGMARLWMANHGRDYPDFFKLRNSLGMDE